MQIIKPDINIDFMGKKKLLMTLSAILLAVSLLPLLIKGGFNYGIDFAGGILAQVKFAKPAEPSALREAMAKVGLEDSTVQSYGKAEDNEYLIRSSNPHLELEGLEAKLKESLSASFGAEGFDVRRVETVGPKVGKELRFKALMAIFFSLLLMAVYISGRFEAKWVLAAVMAAVLAGVSIFEYWILAELMGLGETAVLVIMIVTSLLVTVAACWLLRLRYAMGAVVSLTHDVLITVGIFTMLGKEFNLSTVAAVLTIIGYSINDTIIVYDRIRENLKKNPRQDMERLINDSVNQTLARTVLTVGTVVMVLVALYVLGGGVIEDFALALLIGTVVGTWSSVYVASPMLVLLPGGGINLGLLGGGAKPAPAKAAKPAPRPAPRAVVPEEGESGEAGGRAPLRSVRPRPAKVKSPAGKRKKR